MPHILQITKISDGARYAMFRVYIHSDGLSADYLDEVLVDPADLTPLQAGVPAIAITEMWYDLTGFNLRFKYASVPNTPVWVLGSNTNYIDFTPMGGLADTSGIDGTGKILFDTLGLDTTDKIGTLIVKVRKA